MERGLWYNPQFTELGISFNGFIHVPGIPSFVYYCEIGRAHEFNWTYLGSFEWTMF